MRETLYEFRECVDNAMDKVLSPYHSSIIQCAQRSRLLQCRDLGDKNKGEEELIH